MIQNLPITASDITNDHTIFGSNPAGARGKTAQQKPYRLVMDCVVVPTNFIKLHKFVTIMSDVIFLNGVPFLIIMSHGINFVMVKHIPTHTAKQLIKS